MREHRVTPDDMQRPGATIERRDTRSYGVQGPMTFDSVTDLWNESLKLFENNAFLQIDLAQVTHTDSAGLALLVEWLREASRQGARIEFLNLPSQMLALAGAANLEKLLGAKKDAVRS